MDTISIIEETEARVITLYEILKVINADRKQKGMSDIQHSKAFKIVEDMAKESSFGGVQKFDIVYNNKGQIIQTLNLTKKQALAVGGRLDVSRLMLIINKLEEATKPKTVLELLEDSVKEIKRLGKENLTLKEVIEIQKPKVKFVEAIQGSSSNIDVEIFAKALHDTEGIKIGRNKLFKWFKDNKYLQSNNKPYQYYIDRGLFKLKEGNYINQSTNETVIYTQTRITGKGQLYFTNKLLDELKNKQGVSNVSSI
jgi:phage antirepressor YoqD-like protein